MLLDVLTNDPTHADASERVLRCAAQEGALIVCECVLAEVVPVFGRAGDAEEFLGDWQIDVVPSTRQSALLAGAMFGTYLSRRTARPGPRRVVADFLIGAHARLCADRLLARDRGYFRDYFRGLKIIQP